MTASSLATRTLAEIQTALDAITKMLDDVDAFLQELRNTPCRGDEWVVGFPQYGRYVNGHGILVRVDKCSLLLDRSHAAGMRVVNGHGEVAQVVRYLDALDGVIKMQEQLRTYLCDGFGKLLQERLDAREAYAEMSDEALRDAFEAGDAYAWDVFVARRFLALPEVAEVERDVLTPAETEWLEMQAARHAFETAR